MDAQKSETVAKPVVASCRKKKSDDAIFLQDVKDHIDEFIHASVDEHKTCFTKTIQKVIRACTFTSRLCIFIRQLDFLIFVLLLHRCLEFQRLLHKEKPS